MRVLISGAGVAGPAAAYFLAKSGATVTVVDKAPGFLAHGQNIDIQGSAVSVVKKMGLMDQVRAYNTTEKGSQFVHGDGRPYAIFPVHEGGSRSMTSEYEILRGDLAKILYEPTANHPRVTYLFGTTVKEVISNDDNSVKLELSNGEVHEYDVLIVADGQWSRLRKQNFPPTDLQIVDMNMYAVYFTVPRIASDNDLWNIHMALGSRVVTTRPDPHGTCRGMFTRMPCNVAQKEAWQAAARASRTSQQELLRTEFGDLGWVAPRLLDAMAEAPDFYFQAIQQIRMARWSKNRIVVLGDAAYCPTPLTGMGASLAINGAYVLAGELSKLGEGEHPARALEAYDSAFRPWVEDQQKILSIFPGCAHPETRFQQWLFESTVWMVSKLVKFSWILKPWGFDQNIDVEDFKLPQYPKLEKCLS